jgi:hypothetical protein
MVPQSLPEHPVPDTLQPTLVFAVPVTVAVKRCLSPTTNLAVEGETVTPTVNELPIKILDEPDWLKSASDVAIAVTIGGLGAEGGARYNPPEVIWPQAIPLHPVPARLQITTLLVVPVTVADSCTCPPGFTWGNWGETVTEIEAEANAWKMTKIDKSQRVLKLRIMFHPPQLIVAICRTWIFLEPSGSSRA